MQRFNDDDVMELVEELENVIDMMEPYYKQCDADRSARLLIQKIRDQFPVTIETVENAHCKLCGKTFERSRKGKRLDINEQNTAVSNHLISEHNLHDYKERKSLIKKAVIKTQVFENKAAYEASLVITG